MTRDDRWPSRLFLSARAVQLLVAIAFSLICGTTVPSPYRTIPRLTIRRLRYVISSSISLVTILYLLIIYWCFFTSRLNPTALVGVEFLFVFLWGIAACSVLLIGEGMPWTLGVAAVGLLEMMLLVGTTAMAAAVMHRCRWEEVREEEAVLPDIAEAGVDKGGAVEIAGGETVAELPVAELLVAELPVVKVEISAVGEAVRGS